MSEQNSPAEQPAGATPAGPEAVGQAPAAAEAAPKKKGGFARIIIVILIIAVGGGVAWFLNRDDAMNAKVGDCLGGGTSAETVTAEDLKIMACGEPTAWFKVVQKVDNKTEAAATIDPGCTDASAVSTYWYGKKGESGSVLCLALAS